MQRRRVLPELRVLGGLSGIATSTDLAKRLDVDINS
jgi:hypothetical protein